MPRVLNPLEEAVSLCIHGSWINFPGKGLKIVHVKEKADFIERDRAYTGLRVLPERFDPQSEQYEEGFEKTPEGLKIIAEYTHKGINSFIEHHMGIVRNNQVSLRQDLAHRYPSADAAKLAALDASKGEIESMRLVAKYKGKTSDNDQRKVDEVQKLMEQIGPVVQT